MLRIKVESTLVYWYKAEQAFLLSKTENFKKVRLYFQK